MYFIIFEGKRYSCVFFTGLPCNGTLLFRKIGTRAKYLDHGLVYRFSPLEPHEEEKISQNGMDKLAVLSMQLTFILKQNKVYQTYIPIYVMVK